MSPLPVTAPSGDLPANHSSRPDLIGTTAATAPRQRRDPDQDAPSVRAVLAALQCDHAMTGADLRVASGLPRRTVYSALRVLRARGVLRQRLSLHDTRQTFFWLAREPDAAAETALQRSPGSLAQPDVSAASAGPA
jgi:hypothetical protein